MMFGIYFPVCLRVLIARLVPERDKGKAFSFVALIQAVDIAIGTVACVQIYQASISFFAGLVFLFAVGTRLIALILILIQACCISHTHQLSNDTLVLDNDDHNNNKLIRSELN